MTIKLLSITSEELNDLIHKEITNYLVRTKGKDISYVEIVNDEIEINYECED